MDVIMHILMRYFESHGNPEITKKIDKLLDESKKLIDCYYATISDKRTPYVITEFKPSLTFNIACITGTMQDLNNLRKDDIKYFKAYFGYDAELANKIIKDMELLIAQLNTFIEEYSVIAEQY